MLAMAAMADDDGNDGGRRWLAFNGGHDGRQWRTTMATMAGDDGLRSMAATMAGDDG